MRKSTHTYVKFTMSFFFSQLFRFHSYTNTIVQKKINKNANIKAQMDLFLFIDKINILSVHTSNYITVRLISHLPNVMNILSISTLWWNVKINPNIFSYTLNLIRYFMSWQRFNCHTISSVNNNKMSRVNNDSQTNSFNVCIVLTDIKFMIFKLNHN